MNTANLQMEGLLVALTHLIGALQRKGLLDHAEVAQALNEAETMARANSDAAASSARRTRMRSCFPIRYLVDSDHGRTRGTSPIATSPLMSGRDKDASEA